MPKLHYKAALFDLDGTLLDTTDLIIRSFQHTCRTHLNRDIEPAEVFPYFGRPLRVALEELGPDCVEDLIATYREFNLAHHDDMISAFPGVIATIEQLSIAGVRLAVVTSKTSKTAQRGLRIFGIEDRFDAVIGLNECTKHKPDPEPVRNALAALDVEPNDALLVGDSPSDLKSARSAGVKTVAIRWTSIPWKEIAAENPDYILETMTDLIPIITEGTCEPAIPR